MNKITCFFLLVLFSCTSTTDNYDPSKYYDDAQRANVLTGIVTYIFSAPPYTKMQDRFKPEHKAFYDENARKQFSFDRLYVDGKRHFFLVIRPGLGAKEKRAVGGIFDVADDKQFENFREAFVTPLLSDSVARTRGRFLFDQMVKGDLQRYLKMESYVQWPNAISYYDSIDYEWKMDVSRGEGADSLNVDTVRVN